MTLADVKHKVKVGHRIQFDARFCKWIICSIELRGVVVEHPDGGHKHFVEWTHEIASWHP